MVMPARQRRWMLAAVGLASALVLVTALFFAPRGDSAASYLVLSVFAALLAACFGYLAAGRLQIDGNLPDGPAIKASGGAAFFALVLLVAVLLRDTTDRPSPAPVPSSAEQSLAGVVRDSRGEPLPGVRLSLHEHDDATATSDARGRFQLHATDRPEASVTLLAQKHGYRSREQLATLGNRNLAVTLEVQP